MKQLSGLDASFLYFDTPRTPVHGAVLAILDTSTAPGGYSFEKLKRVLVDRHLLLPRFTERLLPVPYSLDHPYWVRDGRFDIEDHIHRRRLPEPGTWPQLMEEIGRLLEEPLDKSRPLWDLYCLEGLDGVEGVPEGAIGVIVKAHHATADGGAAVDMVNILFDPSPETGDPALPPPSEPDIIPSESDLIGRALRRKLEIPGKLGRLALKSLKAYGRVRRGEKRKELARPPKAFSAPRTRFNAPIGQEGRIYDAVAFDLDEIKEVAGDGVTVNEVVLAVCSGALRRYLESKDELPAESLIAFAPVSVRMESERGTMGNKVTGMMVRLHTEIADPESRLRAIREESALSKGYLRAVGRRESMEFADLISPILTPAIVGIYTGLEMSRFHRPYYNLVITNVRGPQEPRYLAGSRLLSCFGALPAPDGMGLLLAVAGFGDSLTISI